MIRRMKDFWRTAAAAVLPLLCLLSMPLAAKEDFLRPEEAFKYSTRVEGERLIVTLDERSFAALDPIERDQWPAR